MRTKTLSLTEHTKSLSANLYFNRELQLPDPNPQALCYLNHNYQIVFHFFGKTTVKSMILTKRKAGGE